MVQQFSHMLVRKIFDDIESFLSQAIHIGDKDFR